MIPIIVPLDSPLVLSVLEPGEKARNLHLLVRAGFPVPPGFVIDAGALDTLLAKAGREELMRMEANTDIASISALRALSEHAETIIMAIALPQTFRVGIEQALAQMPQCNAGYSVRSSSSVEDLGTGSSAGMFDSVLDVQSTDDMTAAIRKCWGSLWSERAVRYRAWVGAPAVRVSMAVVVQQMVRATWSGVLFTRSPMSPTAELMLLEFVEGIGESLVSGERTPVQIALPRSGAIRKSADGRLGISFDCTVLSRLRDMGIEAEELFGGPQDLEWAVDERGLTILQARPATALGQRQKPLEVPRGAWTRAFNGEWFRSPLSPMMASFFAPAMFHALCSLLEEHFAVRLQRPAWTAIEGYVYFRLGLPTGFGWPIRALVRLMTGFGNVEHDWKVMVPTYLQKVEVVLSTKPDELSPAELACQLEVLRDLIAEQFGRLILTGLYSKLGEGLLALAWRLRCPLAPSLGYVAHLIGESTTTTEADRELDQILATIRANRAVVDALALPHAGAIREAAATAIGGEAAFSALDQWLGRYGHRVQDLDLLEPTLLEDPLPLYQVVHARLARAPTHTLAQQGSMIAPPVGLRRLIRVVRRYYSIREDRPFYFHLPWPHLRQLLVAAGRKLTQKGVVTHAHDVFFLTGQELLAALRGQTELLVDVARKRKRVWLASRQQVPSETIGGGILLQMALAVRDRPSSKSGQAVRGVAASAGVVTAPACLVRHVSEFGKMKLGHVLVTEATTPLWSALFPMAAAVVTERGGTLSHAGIAAREFGIPAVAAVPNAMSTFRDGQMLRVDGGRGTVTALDSGLAAGYD